MTGWKQSVLLAVKGAAMGAANVIPGVSGGTIAFVTGIYEELIHSIKSFDARALRLLCSMDFRGFWAHVNLGFLLPLFAGIGVSILSLAKFLEYALIEHETLTMAFFFGLIAASVFLVGRQVRQWNGAVGALFAIGAAVAAGIAFLKPAQENDQFLYVALCGVVAICSMILPGLSGSYILLIMGNYLLVLRAVGDFQLSILIPLGLGCAVGIVAFSHLLSYIFRKLHDPTTGLLTGFVFGSLAVIWPWKETLYLTGESGEFLLKSGGEKIEAGYRWLAPAWTGQTALALLFVLLGVVLVVALARFDPETRKTVESKSKSDKG